MRYVASDQAASTPLCTFPLKTLSTQADTSDSKQIRLNSNQWQTQPPPDPDWNQTQSTFRTKPVAYRANSQPTAERIKRMACQAADIHSARDQE
jgi:hypothetical protein